jgi:hypothetical protein
MPFDYALLGQTLMVMCENMGHLLSMSCSSSNPALHTHESEVSRDAICYLCRPMMQMREDVLP